MAIVTCAAGGMGRVIAARLADDGCLVAALDVRDTDEAARLRTGRATTFLTADVSSRASLEEALGRVEADLGPPSVLVNSAGVLTRAPFLELADDDWERVLSINLRTVPVGRLGEPEDIAAAVAFLAADSSAFITGAALFVDGGQTLTVAI